MIRKILNIMLIAAMLIAAASCASEPVHHSKPTPTSRPSGDWCEYEGCDQLAVRDFAGPTGPVRYCQTHFDMALEEFHEENQRARPSAPPVHHPCDEPGCTNEAALSITDASGEPKYYCLVHYKGLLEVLGAAESGWNEPEAVQPDAGAAEAQPT